jgi:dTDP-4-amino-4,6-dideoxygalactose transaminase
MNFSIPLADLNFDFQEESAVLDVLQCRWLTMGAVTEEFEGEFARLTGARHAIALSNCTDALHLACLALGIGAGDEVILPSLTFVATANAVLHTGAEVRFADILSPQELTISVEAIRRLVTPRTKAVIAMHYGGYPCRMEEIVDVAKENDLAVIEDAAHAPGASLAGKPLGSWGDAGCFSFFSNKNLATGEGGMLITDRDDIAEKVRLLRSHGMTSLTWDRHRGHAYTYDVVDLGYNNRIDEIHSALGLVQLRKLAAGNRRRAEITERYRAGFKGRSGAGIEIPFSIDSAQRASIVPAYHLLPILLPKGADRRLFMETMRSKGVQTSIHYPSVHKFSYYINRYRDIELPVTEEVSAREVTLPLYPLLKDADVDYILDTVEESLESSRLTSLSKTV